jgi:4-diphosphocytidyl-2-C-methyl-D-erythritol kinase
VIAFPNAKINFGLNIIEKRVDGFHNLETVFYPFDLCDILEVVESESLKRGEYNFDTSGIEIDCSPEDNIIIKAYNLIAAKYDIPGVDIYFHKNIPFGAGLGGGSADAAFMLKLLNDNFNLGISNEQLEEYASQLGSDCPFFINNKPVFAHGKGELFEKTELDLKGMYMVVVKPGITVSTPMAYSGITPREPDFDLRKINELNVKDWKNYIVNDFEENVFKLFPEIGEIKDTLYRHGAVYSAMSGSGAAVFGIFKDEVDLKDIFPDYFYWAGNLSS